MGKNAQANAILDAADVLEIARVTLCLERIRKKKRSKRSSEHRDTWHLKASLKVSFSDTIIDQSVTSLLTNLCERIASISFYAIRSIYKYL